MPRSKVDPLPSPPPSFSQFESDHLISSRPAVLDGLLEEMGSSVEDARGIDPSGGRASITQVWARSTDRPRDAK